MRAFEYRVLTAILGRKRKEVTGKLGRGTHFIIGTHLQILLEPSIHQR
jgi:hypothetical protein